MDRCRPDYALALIETIKHFFAVPHVHFVLGVNLDALQHSVRVRYGAAFDAEEYLRRFIHLRLTLPEKFDKGWGKVDAWELILDRALADMGFERAFAGHLTANITLRCRHEVISIRDLSRVLTRAALLPRKARADGLLQGWREVNITLLLMDVLDTKCFEILKSGRGSVTEVDRFYGLTQTTPPVVDGRQQSPNAGLQVSAIWQFITTNGDAPADIAGKITPMFDPYGRVPDSPDIIRQVFDDHFSNISMFEANQSS